MPIKIWIKLTLLLTAFTFTVVAIFWLKQDHMSSFWTSLGLNQTGTRVNWCEERVGSLYFYDSKAKLFEKDSQWILSQATEKKLDYLRIEKWFAKYCQLPITTIEGLTQESFAPYFEAQFINGDRLTLYSGPSGSFKIRTQVFKSETLRQALKELLAFEDKIE